MKRAWLLLVAGLTLVLCMLTPEIVKQTVSVTVTQPPPPTYTPYPTDTPVPRSTGRVKETVTVIQPPSPTYTPQGPLPTYTLAPTYTPYPTDIPVATPTRDIPDAFTVVLLPDTQHYSDKDPSTYLAQIRWIVGNAALADIRFVVHLGDITEQNTEEEWKNASAFHRELDRAGIPYSVVPGNHDNPEDGKKRDTFNYNRYFGPDRFAGRPWYGCYMGTTNDNNCTFFEAGELKFMVVGLEFAPTKDALCWADSVIKNHPERRVIIVTHCYQDHGGQHRTDCATYFHIVGSGGNTVWNELVRRHSNIFMVLSGHIHDSEYVTRIGNGGNTVHEILTDYQDELRDGEEHGNGWLRTLTFVPSEERIYVRSLSVLADVSEFNSSDYPGSPSDPVHTYSLGYSMSGTPPPSYSYAKVSNSFNDMTVNSKGTRQQKRAAVAVAPDGSPVVVWEGESTGAENVYQIHARGFRADGCERFHDTLVSKEPKGQQHEPAVAVAADGSFVVVWEDDQDGDDRYRILAAGFDSHGSKRLDDYPIGRTGSGDQREPDVAMDAEGNLVVVWKENSGEPGVYQIHMAGFDSGGSQRFVDTPVNPDPATEQRKPAVAVATDGSFVVVWEDDSTVDSAVHEIRAAGFYADGSERVPDATVNKDKNGKQRRPDIAMDAQGNFVVVWEDDSRGTKNVYQIFGAGFHSNGSRRFYVSPVNAESTRQQLDPAIAMAPDGSFVVVWQDDSTRPKKVYEIFAAGFDPGGSKRLHDTPVNGNSRGQQEEPDVAMDAEGNFVVVWKDDLDKNEYYEILARGLDTDGN